MTTFKATLTGALVRHAPRGSRVIPALLGLLLLLVTGCGRNEKHTVIKLGHGLDQSHPVHKAMVRMGERLAELSSGSMRIDIYPSEQLGSERECLELLQVGGLGMTKTSASVLESFVPAYKVLSLPYLYRDEAHKQAVWQGAVGHDLLLGSEPLFLRGLCYYEAGSRSFYTRNRRIESPGDLAGLKIRTQQSPMAIKLVQALGGSPTPIAWGELYTALQQGVVDGAENNPPSFHLSRHYEVCKYFTLDEHTAIPDVLLISTHVWTRLSPLEQEWLQQAADESAQYQRTLWREATEKALEEVRKAGVEVILPNQQAFSRQVQPMHAELSKDPKMAALIERIRDAR